MCGLVGVVGNLFEKDKRMFETLLKLDTIRGPHSTGVARVGDDGKVGLVKEVGTPWDLIQYQNAEFYNGCDRKVIGGSMKVLMGHNRWATIGAVNADNAHPFHVGKIVGAHNGTLLAHSQRKLFRHEHLGTDSEAVMSNLNEHGVEDTFGKLEGAWALTWYNTEEDTFNIVRNKERPLYYSYNKKGDVLYYASEPWMIFTAAERHDVELSDPDRVFSFAVDTHYKWKVGPSTGFGAIRLYTEERKGYVYVAPPRMEVTRSNVVPFPASSTNSSNVPREKAADLAKFWGPKTGQYVEFKLGNGWQQDEQRKKYIQCFSVLKETEIRVYLSLDDPLLAVLGADDAEAFTAKIKKVKFVSTFGGKTYMTVDLRTIEVAETKNDKPEPIDDDIPWLDLEVRPEGALEDVVIGPEGREISHSQFIHMTSKGCCWCNYQPQTTESKELVWISNSDEFLCEDCSQNDNIKQYIHM